VYLSTGGRSVLAEKDFFLASIWQEYGKCDKRWWYADSCILSLEIVTVFADSLFCIILIYAMLKNKPYRHFFQIVLATCELYGGWMTFAPELLTGNKNLVTNNFVYLYIYLIFFNGIWVVVPFLLMIQSWYAIATDESQKLPNGKHSSKQKAN